MAEQTIPMHQNYGFIVGSALRYALWRHSYAVSLTANYIRDIEEHLENVKDEWVNDPLCDMDLKTWQTLINDLKSNGIIQN